MAAVLLALVTAVSYGVANYVGPLLTRRLPLGGVLVVGQTVGVLAGLVLVAVVGFGHPGAPGIGLGLLAGLFNGLGLASFYLAAARGSISIVAPIGATGAVVPVLVALATGERPAVPALVGIPLAVVGVALAAARPAAGQLEATTTGAGTALFSAAAFGALLGVVLLAAG